MNTRLRKFLLILACGIATGTSAHAERLGAKPCSGIWPDPFSNGQPFLLNDPRSGLALYLESDGRHMAAITRDGKILWHRNLFSDPKLERFFPRFHAEGEPVPPLKEWRDKTRSYISQLGIDRIGIEPDCMLRFIDHELPAQFHGHYVLAGSGTQIFWLLDAKTGDLVMEEMN